MKVKMNRRKIILREIKRKMIKMKLMIMIMKIKKIKKKPRQNHRGHQFSFRCQASDSTDPVSMIFLVRQP